MKNIIYVLLTLLILLTGSTYTKSQVDTTTFPNQQDVELMMQLIPELYRDVLRKDSCIADAIILDSMVRSLNVILDTHVISEDLMDQMIDGLNKIIEEKNYVIDRRDDQIVLVKKQSFWRGFKWGSGVTGVILILILIL
jgi:predicted P-loop ATPase/GTPase